MADITIDRLEIEIAANSDDASWHIERLTQALKNLKAATYGGAGLTSVNRALKNMVNSFGDLNRNSAAFERLRQRIEEVNAPVRELVEGFDDLSGAAKKLNNVGESSKEVGEKAKKAAADTKNFGAALKDLRVTAVAGYAAIKKVASTLRDIVDSASDYVEDMNLFSVSMGQYAASAKEYADEVNSALGIDTGDWMRAQGVFMQLATGFGVAGDQAAYMSKNLTQISYDLASFFNLDPEEAVNKVRSGLSGELEPLRNLGYALDRNTLQEVARARGITKSIDAMSQAEKAQLRYIAILTQNQNVMGDMSRTIEAPANAMRVLEQQVKQLGRAFGNFLIPWLQQLIPVVQAVVTVLTEFMNMLARLVGFELPEISSEPIDSVTTGATDAEEALSGAAGAANELKNAVLGIDELNVISPNSGSGGAGAATGSDVFFGDLPGYDDFINNISEKTKYLTDKIRKQLQPLFDFVEDHFDEVKLAVKIIGLSLAALKVAGLISSLSEALTKMDKLGKAVSAVAEITLQFVLNKWTMDSYLTNDSLGALLGNVLTTAFGSWLLYKTLGPKGIVIGAAVSVVANAVSIGLAIADGVVAADDPDMWVGALVSTAVGGLIGAYGLMKVVPNLGGSAIGISLGISAMITISSILFGGVASGSFDTSDKILATLGNVVAGGLAGSLIGNAALGTLLGAAAGPVGFGIGIGVAIVLSIAAIKAGEAAKVKAAYEASDFHAQLQEISEWASETMEITKEINIRIQSRIEDFNAITDSFDDIRTAVDKLFDLNNLPVKTDETKKLMKAYTDIINGAAGEIIVHYDDLTGSVAETRDEIYKYIDSLEQQAKAEAAYDSLVESLKEQLSLERDLKKAQTERTQVQNMGRTATTKYAEAIAKRNEYEHEMVQIYGVAAPLMKMFDQTYIDLTNEVDTYALAVKESDEKMAEMNATVNTAQSAYDDASESVDFFTGVLNDYKGQLPDTTSATDDMSNAVNGAFDETKERWTPEIEEAINGILEAFANGQIDVGEAVSQIESIVGNTFNNSDLYNEWRESGRWLMKGFAEGIEAEMDRVELVVEDVATGATRSLNRTLEINSPSRKWMESGYWLDAGLALGIEQNAASVMDTVGDLAGNLETGIDPNGWYSNNWQPAANYRTGSYAVSIDWREFLEQLREVMTEAMSENSTDDDKSVYVYLDGKQISSVNEKWQRDRGAAIFGTGVRP